ncbi:MAG: hypothetical protein J6X28_03000 [Bacilli bacterium]|nr:hypothetical protein [Bacilli bacterium]
MEFQEADYDRAISLADNIYNSATRIHDVFDDIDGLMRMLHGTHWESRGSEDVNAEYLAHVKSQFEPFYQDVVTMRNHIYEVTGRNQQADAAAAGNI